MTMHSHASPAIYAREPCDVRKCSLPQNLRIHLQFEFACTRLRAPRCRRFCAVLRGVFRRPRQFGGGGAVRRAQLLLAMKGAWLSSGGADRKVRRTGALTCARTRARHRQRRRRRRALMVSTSSPPSPSSSAGTAVPCSRSCCCI